MILTKIALLTDSSADLRWEARENNIFLVPLRILCQDGEYLDGGHSRAGHLPAAAERGAAPDLAAAVEISAPSP